jgi:DNA-binding MarR family transcriptional regulator
MPTARDWDALDRGKRASAGQLLIKGARLLQERFLARINREGPRVTLRRAHTSLLPHIDQQGTRLTELARRLGITKQAAGQLVSDLESMGSLERVADPQDGRAKLVRFTDLGLESIHHGLSVMRQIESELEAVLGKTKMRQLHQALLLVVDELSRPERGSRRGRTAGPPSG